MNEKSANVAVQIKTLIPTMVSAAAKMRAILEEPFEPFCERSIAALAPPFPCRRIPGERGVLPVR